MSHYIEYKKQVVHIEAPESDERFRPFRHIQLYLSSGGSNNVEPRSRDWSLVGIKTSFEKLQADKGHVELPARMWEMAGAADGGMIQPNGRTTTGVKYIESWKKAAREAYELPLSDSRLPPWCPTLQSYGMGKGETPTLVSQQYNDMAALQGISDRLPWSKMGAWHEARITTAAQLLDAVYLISRLGINEGISITDHADSRFLDYGPTPDQLRQASPAPVPVAATPPASDYLPTADEPEQPGAAQAI